MYFFSYLEPVYCSMSSSNCCFLTCIQVSQRQVRWSDIPISKNVPQFIVIHRVKGFGKVNKAKVDVFLEFSSFFLMIQQMLKILFVLHVLLKPGLENFKHCFASVWDECNCSVLWTFFGVAFLLGWNENWPFPALWSLLSFPSLLAYWVQHFNNVVF